jgi:hypothetical protein
MAELISKRGSSECRVCGANDLVSVLDLGAQPLPAEYGSSSDEVMEVFPLHLHICPACGLGQLGEYVLPDRIFHAKYPYLSSASSTWVEHAKKYASAMVEKLSLDDSSLVVELASNDGYLLSEFRKLGIRVLGVEPAANVAEMAEAVGVPTIAEFFGAELAEDMVSKHGHPRLIVANNVFAHVPDMHDFTQGMAILADSETVITIENPSFAILLQETLFDTIYHEHYSYLTAHSIRSIARSHGLDLFHVDRLPTHGGSNRYWLSKSRTPDQTVEDALDAEVKAGLFDREAWESFAERSKTAIAGLREWLTERKAAGAIVAGYGAAHKGNTFLNAVGAASKTMVYVVDASMEKHGKFLPGSQLPVLPPNQLNSANPTDVLILPWNIAPELAKRIEELAPQAHTWVAQPSIRQI